jgi:hypothetical protein
MPDDSIMDMVNNIEPFYNDVRGLYEKWVREDEGWDKKEAFKEARALAAHFAEALEGGMVRGKYSERDINTAAREMIDEFINVELPKWSVVKKEEAPAPSEPMTEYEIEQAKKNEALAQKIGIDRLKLLMPASHEQIREALLRGDKGLRSIPLRKWDAKAASLRIPGLTISNKVSLLKHVAAYHYGLGRASMGAVEGWVVTHDGETLKTGFKDDFEAGRWLHNYQSASISHAVKYEGYDIVLVRGGKVVYSYNNDQNKK